jgi:hypothetical protein
MAIERPLLTHRTPTFIKILGLDDVSPNSFLADDVVIVTQSSVENIV